MTEPKRPALTPARIAWLASLKPGDDAILWRRGDGWCPVRVIAPEGRKPLIRLQLHPADEYYGWSVVPSKSGVATEGGHMARAIFPPADAKALRGLEISTSRRWLRDSVRWAKVSDDAILHIADIARVDLAKKEPHS